MSDFMREVDEEYRRERTMRFLSRYQILIALVVIGIVVGAGVWRYLVDRRIATAEADNSRFAAAETQARDGAAAEARKAYAALVANGVAGYPLLAGMREAEELAATDPEGAAKRFDNIASGEGGSQAMRDAARYRGALLRVDREDPTKFEEQYGRFALDGFAFHAGIALHVRVLSGRDPHHIVEAQFKAVARAVRAAVARDPRVVGIPSAKGTL